MAMTPVDTQSKPGKFVMMWRAGNGSRQLLISYLVFLTAVLVLVCAGVFAVAAERSRAQWDPLGEYPQQVVHNTVVRLSVDPHVYVSAKKCADVSVQVTGVTRWQSVNPPGTIVLTGSGSALRPQGCENLVYVNPVPQSIRDIIDNGGPRQWIISGTETPIKNGQQGVPRAWQTNTFKVVP